MKDFRADSPFDTNQRQPSHDSPEKVLREYASQFEDMGRDVEPEELDWIYVEAMPVPFCLSDRDWHAFWSDEIAETTQHGMQGLWDHLLNEDITTPIVVGLYGSEQFAFWDGNHRVGAIVVSGRKYLRAVVGIARNLTLDELPTALREVPEFVAKLAGIQFSDHSSRRRIG